METILKCPNEILQHVARCLPSADLSSLGLVNRALSHAIEPILYSNIELIWPRTKAPPIISLIRSLQRRPVLASYVKRLVFTTQGFQIPSDPHEIPANFPELADLVQWIKMLNLPFCDLWIQELEAGKMDAFVALLLAMVANLSHLELDTGSLPGKISFLR